MDVIKLNEFALEEALKSGADSAEVSTATSDNLCVDARNGEVETVQRGDSKDFSITVYLGQHKGSATSSGLEEENIRKTITAACDIAKHTAEDKYTGLAPAELMATEFPDLDTDHPWDIDVEAAINMAVECEDTMRQGQCIINSEGASVSTGRVVQVYSNTHGFHGKSAGTSHSISAVAVAGDNGQMQRDHHYSCHRHHDRLESPADVGAEAARRAAQRLNAQKISTRKMPVMLSPEIARGLLGQFVSAISGGLLYREASFLLNMLGKQCFPPFVRLMEYPHLRGELGSASFDSEGVATPGQRTFVEDGILRHYMLDSYAARKMGMTSTGNADGIHNLTIETEGAEHRPLPFKELLSCMNNGFLVTELIGMGVNLVTGDYSRGAVGFLIENGEVSHAVEEVAIAGNLSDMFRGITAVGTDVDRRGAIHSGSLIIDGMTVAGG